MIEHNRIAIIGTGSLGTSIAEGIVESAFALPEDVTLTRRKLNLLDPLRARGFLVTSDNKQAVRSSRIVIVAVEPRQLADVLSEIRDELSPGFHILISVVSGASLSALTAQVPGGVSVARAMPNTAVAVRESMTCITCRESDEDAVETARAVFSGVGQALFIDEELMTSATALGACGIAFFLRSIRAASQGGIEIGFHAHDALTIAAQTAKGAASLLISSGHHPEHEIDKVTTPRGCTIAGLNRMEHEGFSSAMIRGITVAAENARDLYSPEE